MNSTTYLSQLKTLEAVWDRHANKNFYQNVRRAVQAWLAEGQGVGQRRNDQNMSRNNQAAGAPPPPDDDDVDWKRHRQQQQQRQAGGANVDQNPETPTRMQRGIEEILGDLSFNNTTMMHHAFAWREGIRRDLDPAALIEAPPVYKRVSVDVLLPGSTNLDQLECSILQPASQKKVKIKYTPPRTFWNARRTAVRMAAHGGVRGAAVNIAADRLLAMHRVTSHEDSIAELTPDDLTMEFTIDLPFEVEPDFTTRNDWGVVGQGRGVQIATYRHEDNRFVVTNQVVWILHLEMVARERRIATPSRPADAFDEMHMQA
ncbi:hypothetical protein SEMRO_13_G010130.1 [Seminavis robusta]|uniref:Uncharacterized protein n=1 Tax=Seminavis robusta TaxID=568900 RepID=A0A9N8D608_9STRA|nr:hypothetical protein SEMRO_13_G010130.1 [Seminavis robusta]|eukprot:Sro13_g010130.1 n/a (316) ;mRNA; f:125070-126118